MICPRCGTEHTAPDRVCPRCFYGRPKMRKHMPKWLVWVMALAAAAVVITVSVNLYFEKFYNNNWMHGAWDSKDLSLSFNCEDDTFMLFNGETVIAGDFTATQDSFTLTAEDGKVYIYRYEKISNKKMKLIFNRGEEIRMVTVKKQAEAIEEEEPEDEPLDDDAIDQGDLE